MKCSALWESYSQFLEQEEDEEKKEGEGERRRRSLDMDGMLHQVPLELRSQSCGFRSRQMPSLALQPRMSSSSEPHYQYAKGQSLLLGENLPRGLFYSED